LSLQFLCIYFKKKKIECERFSSSADFQDSANHTLVIKQAKRIRFENFVDASFWNLRSLIRAAFLDFLSFALSLLSMHIFYEAKN